MKCFFTFLILFLSTLVFAQSDFPSFLQGSWKAEGNEIYEHWDKINDNTLKGFSYKLKDGQVVVSEYLEMSRRENEVFYTATVLNQNRGNSIDFKLTKTDSVFTFENPDHDFPKKIVYRKLNDTQISVHISDGKEKGFSYRMEKQNKETIERDPSVANPEYDAALAQKLGGDDYGMKSYVLVLLKTGANKTTDKVLIDSCFRGHLDNIGRLVEQGKLIVAGPLGKNEKTYRGIFILNVTTTEEAETLLQTDPAIKAGLLDTELYNWYGSAALPEYLESSDKIWKIEP